MKIFSGIIFALWWSLIIYLYYSQNSSHIFKTLGFNPDVPNNFSALYLYFAIILLFYGFYKIFAHIKNQNNWSFFWILWAFFLQLLAVCGMYTSIVSAQDNFSYSTITLFWHIFTLTLYPIFLVLLWRSVGKSIFHFWKYWKNISLRVALIIETAVGFGVFALFLGILGKFWIYNSTALFGLIITLSAVSFLGWKDTFVKIFSEKIKNFHSPLSTYAISAEIAFILFSFVASVSLINVLRPMPIGWDDLGVYMNFPKIIATTSTLLEGAGMYTWQLITGTGFLLGNNATQAFFINQIGGILATIAIISGISFFLSKGEKSKNFFCLPMILGVSYYLLPMTVFQQAKDMKLDPMLLFITISAFLAAVLAVREFYNSEKISKNFYGLLLLAGVLTGIAFGVKLTSLILILSLLAFIHYSLFGLAGFIGFTGIFIAIFTKFHLWAHMFVNIGENFSGIIALFAFIIGIAGYIFVFFQRNIRENFGKIFTWIIIFCLGIGVAVLPWLAHNFSPSSAEKFSINLLLNGDSSGKENGTFSVDFSKIYSATELEKRKNENDFRMITTDGTSNNEDFGRYFGQEKGINNYIKLPINLTLQQNQTGEFTDITYIFLAFVPVALLFFRSRNPKIWTAGIIFFLILGLISFAHILAPQSVISAFFTNIFFQISLPTGYLVLLSLVFGFLIFAHFLRRNEDWEITGILIFTGFYGLIFWISAFGVVWYGITIYFAFLLIIATGLQELNFAENFSTKNPSEKIFSQIILSFFVFAISIYLVGSAQIHAFSNLKTAGYNEYKYHILPQNTSIFLYKREYFENLLELNVKNQKILQENLIKNISDSPILKAGFEKNFPNASQSSLLAIHEWLQKNLVSVLRGTSETEINIRTEISRILEPFYEEIIYPSAEQTNDEKIYRIGTFLTYFINKNRSRYYDDSLIQNFQTYFYGENPNETLEKMKKVGIKYLLVDLNAATIDNGEFHLTKRYENLLRTLRSDKLKLINTDSVCLRIALDEYHNKNISEEEFLKIAWVNYRNFFWKNSKISPMSVQEKFQICANQISKIFQKEQFFVQNGVILTDSGNTYPRSQEILFFLGNAESTQDFNQKLLALLSRNSWFALFEIQ